MSASIYTGGSFVPPSSYGLNLAAKGGPGIVFNLSSKTAQTGEFQDPYDITFDVNDFGRREGEATRPTPSAGATPANVVPVAVPDGCMYLDLYHRYAGVADPTTQLKVRVFGWVPHGRINASALRRAPSDIFPSSFDDFQGSWIPLENPVSGEVEQTFDNTAALISVNGTGSPASRPERMSPRKSVYVAGCTHAIVVVTQAADQAGNGVVWGRFVS